MITRGDYLMSRDEQYPLTAEMEKNMIQLLLRINKLEAEPDCPIEFKVSSGYRPGVFNVKAGGSLKSAHRTCEAVDIVDSMGKLDEWLTDAILLKYDLYREHPSATKTWCHLTTRRPKSGKRTFYP